MRKYPIHATIEGPQHGTVVEGVFTYNPIPEEEDAIINYKGMKIKVQVDMNFYTDPSLTIFKILKVND